MMAGRFFSIEMDHELAKALRQAGFPQGAHACACRTEHPEPTLEELVDACGTKFKSLHKYLNPKWGAKHDDGREFEGATPTEAVARLWISSQ